MSTRTREYQGASRGAPGSTREHQGAAEMNLERRVALLGTREHQGASGSSREHQGAPGIQYHVSHIMYHGIMHKDIKEEFRTDSSLPIRFFRINKESENQRIRESREPENLGV
jgi:hypothetical protein